MPAPPGAPGAILEFGTEYEVSPRLDVGNGFPRFEVGFQKSDAGWAVNGRSS
jgi:hypothetical protein